MKTTKRRHGRAVMAAAPSSPVPPREQQSAGLPWKRILVPYDFSKPARQAFDSAVRLAREGGAKLILVHVVAPLLYPPDTGLTPLLEKDLVKGTLEKLQALADTVQPSEMVEKVIVRTGTPFVEIVRAAERMHVDLVLLATHGFTGLKHVFMGSTAERVVRHAPCAVLVSRSVSGKEVP